MPFFRPWALGPGPGSEPAEVDSAASATTEKAEAFGPERIASES